LILILKLSWKQTDTPDLLLPAEKRREVVSHRAFTPVFEESMAKITKPDLSIHDGAVAIHSYAWYH
jgi:hypothetical protein